MKYVVTLFLTLLMLLGCCAQADTDQRGEMVLSVAVSELGYTATKGGYSKYGEWGGNAYGEWCTEFVTWCVNRADELYGVSMLGVDYPNQKSCEGSSAWFKEQGRYVTVNGGLRGEEGQFYLSDGVSVADRPYIPQPGDFIFIEWYKYNRLDHVGIVEYVTQEADGSYMVHTIEGNNHILGPTPSVVGRYSYRLDDPSIRGYGVLEEGLVGTTLETGSSGELVVAYQRALKEMGYYDSEGGKYGKGTADATKAFQRDNGLDATGVADAATQRVLGEKLSALRAQAEEQALAAAQAQVQESIEAAKAAIQSAWFGEFDPLDEDAAWARLTADITVLDVDQKEKVYLSDGPNGNRKTYDSHRGFFYGESVAVKVLGEQDGWTKIEAYNDCDELEQGWVREGRIKTVTPNQVYGIIVDKMTQTLYLYKEGKLLTTLLCSTGTAAGANEDYNETASGEFLLCSWTGGFWSGNLYCDQAIRFNGGDLMHMVPAIYSGGRGEDGSPLGTPDYSICESALGRRASHGCVRVQRDANEDGYNHQWLWNNLRGQKNIKIIIWDDDGRKLNRVDDATPMYYNPDGGAKFHTVARCQSVRSTYLPLTAITYGDLTRYPYTSLTPCTTCAAPQRPEVVDAWNETIDRAYEELGLTP